MTVSPEDKPAEFWSFCLDILPEVSRSFALIIPRCPPPLDQAMCVGYLICRVADTIEDEVGLARSQRARLYDAFLAAVDAPAEDEPVRAFLEAWPRMPEADEGRLIAGVGHVVDALAALPRECRTPIQHCVHEMIAGMRKARPSQTRQGIHFLCTDMAALETYCHYVAGTVGIMSTTLFETRLQGRRFHTSPEWREQGRRLGLGLQLTNIIKDCQVDAERGVSFIPADCVDLSGDEYRPYHIARADLIGRAIAHLDAGLDYTLAVPVEETGIRTFLLGALLPAIATLELAAPGTERQPKIDRAQMAEIFTLIDEHGAEDGVLSNWYMDHRRRTLAALATGPGSSRFDR